MPMPLSLSRLNIVTKSIKLKSRYVALLHFSSVRCPYFKPVLVLRPQFYQAPNLFSFSHVSSIAKHSLKETESQQEGKSECANTFDNEDADSVIKKSIDKNSSPLSSHSQFKNDLPSCKACDTIVNKYSPVPSLPRSSHHEIIINMPEEPSSSEIPSPIKRFFLGRFTKYLEKFYQSLANEMPDTFHMLSTFTNGFKEFVVDFRDYITVAIKISLPFYDLEDLTRRELELFYNMPRQMIRVFPVMAISSLPFAQNVVLPVAYWFPRLLLCYHFWDSKQRLEFPVFFLRKRLFNARPVFRSLQTRIDEVQNPILNRKCQSIFYSLGSGVHPTMKQILEVKELFAGEPYHLNLLWANHVNGLLRLYNRSVLFRRRNRLREHARYIHCMDLALIKEGIELLTSEQLRNMLLLRGVNPTGMSDVEKRNFLDTWVQISEQVNENSYSLLLHLPILLSYNHPTNLALIYS